MSQIRARRAPAFALPLCVAALIAAIALAGCGAADLSSITLDGSHVLVSVEGDAAISRFGWAADQLVPARFGAIVRTGDLIELGEDAHVTLVCADLSLSELKPGANRVPCLPRETALDVRNARGLPARSSTAAPFQILEPRGPLTRSERPLLRWEPMAGADGYRVTLDGGGLSWSERSDEPSIAFPTTLDPLPPDTGFVLTVEPYSLLGGVQAQAKTQFRTLAEESRRALNLLEQEIAGLPLSEPARQLVLANLYASNRLYADALALVEPLYAEQPEPPLALFLGDRAFQLGLLPQAEEYFLAAHGQALALGDAEVETRAALQLARIALCERSDADTAAPWQEVALAGALRLGDKPLAEEARALSGENPCVAERQGAPSTDAP